MLLNIVFFLPLNPPVILSGGLCSTLVVVEIIFNNMKITNGSPSLSSFN